MLQAESYQNLDKMKQQSLLHLSSEAILIQYRGTTTVRDKSSDNLSAVGGRDGGRCPSAWGYSKGTGWDGVEVLGGTIWCATSNINFNMSLIILSWFSMEGPLGHTYVADCDGLKYYCCSRAPQDYPVLDSWMNFYRPLP